MSDTAFYFDGKDETLREVLVLLFNAAVHLYATADNQLLKRFPLRATIYKKQGDQNLLFLNEQQTEYLQFSNHHPLTATLAREVAEAALPRTSRLVRSRALRVLAFLLAFAAGMYFLIISLVPYFGSKLIGTKQEIELGDRIHAAMLAEAGLLGEEVDKAKTAHLQAFADQLKLSNNYPIRVTLVKSNTVNAYALPGGHVVVYTGLLKRIKTPEALAALLAHECTHVNERHSLRSLLRSAASSIAIAVVFGDASGTASILASNADALNRLRYSRSLEEEADSKGMDLLVANGIPADGMKQLMQTLQQAEAGNPGMPSFLSSHPLTAERLQAAEKYIEQHPQKAERGKELQLIFERLRP
jgi:beta-barrel assembly-enhancing protease